MNQDKISNSPDCFRNKACSGKYMHQFTAIVPKLIVTLKFYKCACATPHLHKISNLTKRIVSTGQFIFYYDVLKRYMI